MGLQTRGDFGRFADETDAAALAVGHADAAGDGVIDFLAGRHPHAGDPGLAREHAALGGSESGGRITALVLEQMPQILVTREAKEPPTAAETRGKLKVSDVGAAVRIKPILFLGEIVVGNAGVMERSQCCLGGAEVADIAMWFG